MSFSELSLNESLLKAIEDKGYTTPTDIQKEAIPVILSNRDVLASSQTGTGKTASFVLPILQMIYEKDLDVKKVPKALVLLPTRELATQVASSIATYGRHLSIRSTAIFGGVNMIPQIERLKKGVDIITATPGRLIDLINKKRVDLSQIKHLVLDEADRMLDMGFIDDIKRILSALPEKKQILMFSATYSSEIKYLTRNFQSNPAIISVAAENSTVDKVKQTVYNVPRSHRTALLIHLIISEKWQQALIFAPTKNIADRIVESLTAKDINACAIHSNKTQFTRMKILKDFKEKEIKILVATDIAARGLDINDLPYVVNYELPQVSEDYVHRIGRTARAGKSGEAISFVSQEEKILLKKVERFINAKITVNKLPLLKVERKKGDNYSSKNPKGKKSKPSPFAKNNKKRFDEKSKPSASNNNKKRFEGKSKNNKTDTREQFKKKAYVKGEHDSQRPKGRKENPLKKS